MRKGFYRVPTVQANSYAQANRYSLISIAYTLMLVGSMYL